MKTTALVNTSLLLVIFFFSSFLFVSRVNAGWNCCTENLTTCQPPHGCAVNPSCTACQSTELKNPGTNNGVNECKPGTVSNACDVTPGTATQCKITYTPKSLTVTEGLSGTVVVSFNTSNIAKLTAVSSNSLTAIVSPSTLSAPAANKAYSYRVLAGKPGSATAVIKGISTGAGYEQVECTANIPVTVVKNNNNALACNQGATCKPENGAVRSGVYINCSMPVVPDSVLTANNARKEYTNYSLACDLVNSAGTVKSKVGPITQTNNANFNRAFLYSGAAGDKYKCSFRYCVRLQDLSYKCSNWGAAS